MSLSEASSHKIITLITDFGYKDPFVGQMKGVILKISPHVKIVDITHDISSHNIEEASFFLYTTFKYFPEESIHIVVVDPEVGSGRKALALKSQEHYFLAPDNGVLSYVIKDKPFKAVSIENEKYILKKESPTFQGRDIFAPTAAWLSRGVSLEEFGRAVPDPVLIDVSMPYQIQGKIIGKIIHIDKFGNAITNIETKKEMINHVRINNLKLQIVNCYSESPQKPAAIINSDGFVEIFIYQGSAEKTLNLKKDDSVEVILHG